MRNFLSVIAFALMGSVMTGCSSENDLAGNQQPAVKDNIVTVTTTIGLGGDDATTRALSANGVKTFAEDDQIALFYQKSGFSNQFKAVATAENISADGKSATFTFELDNPESGSDISLCYPAAFMDEVPMEFYPAFAQDGTLNGGVKANDLGFATGKLVGTALPASITLTNRFAVVAFTLKDGKGTADKADDVDVTSTITEMTIELPDSKTYTITREAADGPIYVVLPPISSGEINITATGGGKTYTKTLDNKTYAASNFYRQGLLMTKQASAPEGAISGKFSVSATKQVYFSQGNLQATTTDLGEHWTWAFAANQWDYIGNAAANTAVNGNGTVSANGTVDLFGWVGESNTTWSGELGTTGNAAMHGISNSTATNNTDGYGVNASEALKSDWGTTINDGYTWFTLSSDEWTYLFNTRTVNGGQGSGYSYTLGQSVNGKLGVVIYPDDYTGSEYAGSDWSTFEAAGCVFLPAAGSRNLASSQEPVYDAGSYGFYWSSSAHPSAVIAAYRVFFSSSSLIPLNINNRALGGSVRLVRLVQP